MNKETLAKIKQALLEERTRVMNELNRIADNGENRAKFPDFGDKQDENVLEIDQYSTNLATEKVLESSLRDIDNALARIKDGTYGICKYCKKEIDEKRLLARPVASACIDCKNKLQNSF